MPMSVLIGVLAVVAVVVWTRRSAEPVSPTRTVTSVVGLWVAMMLIAILAVTIATLVFGR